MMLRYLLFRTHEVGWKKQQLNNNNKRKQKKTKAMHSQFLLDLATKKYYAWNTVSSVW